MSKVKAPIICVYNAYDEAYTTLQTYVYMQE